MSTVPAVHRIEPERAPHVTSTRAESAGRRYFAVCVALCLFVYLFPILAFRSRVGSSSLLSYWGTVVNVSYSNEKQDADIVLFGDSTVATNVDPMRMSRDLHLKVIALPNVSTSLPVSGYAPLEHYLQRNKPPRLIVFYLSGWDLDFLHNPFTEIVEEGEEMLLLHGSSKEVIHYAILHPRKAIMFSLHFYGNTNRIGDLLHFRKHETPSLDRGHILLLSHPTPMKPNCAFDMALVNKGQGDASSRESLIHFTTPETQTMVVISPVPACKQLDKVTSMPHEGLQLPPVLVLPPSSFREDGWQAHILTGKIGPATDSLETLIREKLKEGAGVTSQQ